MIRFAGRMALLLGVLTMAFAGGMAQTGGEKAPEDTTALNKKYWLRQNLYENNETAFAPPRKDRWSFGIQKGVAVISGDVRPERGLGIGINARKSVSHLVSIRGQITTGYATGLNWRPSGGFLNNTALNGFNNPSLDYTTIPYPFVFYNYRMRYWDAGVHGVLNFGNMSFTNRAPNVSAYLFAGPGLMLYNTQIDAQDEDFNEYDYSGIPTDEIPDVKQDVLNGLRNILDGEYESQAEFYTFKPSFRNRTVLPTAQFGLGIAFKMSDHVDISLEHRVTFSNDDLLDGQRWEETLTPSANNDFLHFSTIGINYRPGKNRQDSRWWSNPLEKPLGDITDLKRVASNDVKDSDNDGVVDAMDLESGTPEGVSVDMRGRALDIDGDGIPDFRDKEPFSPKGAEIDAGGMAVDSDRDGVIDLYDQEDNTPEGVHVDPKGIEIKGINATASIAPVTGLANPLPMIHFDLGKSSVKKEFYPDLLRVTRYLKANPALKLVIMGHTDVQGNGTTNANLSENRAQNVMGILAETFGIEEERMRIEGKGAEELLIEDVSSSKDKNEALHYLNRRVEFIVE